MKTKLFTLLLAVAASVGTMFASTKIGDLYYNLDATNQTAEVTYQLKRDVNNYKGLTTANIPAFVTYNSVSYSVTSIGDYAFYNCRGLTSVTIPNSVTSIGNSAFEGCSSLTSIEIPNSVTSIGNDAFYGCSGLTSVTIPNSVTSIGNFAFAECTALTSVTIPNSVTSIGNFAFAECTALTSPVYNAHIFACLPTSYSGAFTIPDGIESIAGGAFYNCYSLTSVTIPNSVTSIGSSAFYNCSSLTYVTIPNSVTSIGNFAFSGCSGLTSVTIGNSVTSIGGSAFENCSGLTSVIWNAKNCADFASNNTPFYADYYDQEWQGYIRFDLRPQITSFTFGNEVEHIPANLCNGMFNLTSIEIPNSVTSIGNSAFENCSGLTSVIWNAKNCADFASNNTPFYGLRSQITSFTFGNEVEHIPAYLCYGMSNLTSIEIPNSVTSIGGGAFSGCTGLTGELVIPNSVTSIGSSAFRNCSGLTSVTIPNSVTRIEYDAFQGCSSLTSVTIPNSVTEIGSYAFYGCTGLTSVTIPNSVTSIGERAFYGCSGLTSVTIGNSVTSIGQYAFWGCSGLTSVTIPGCVTSIGAGAFWGCSGLTSMEAPAGFFDVPEGSWPSYTKILNHVTVIGGELTENALLFINRSYKTLQTLDVSGVTNTEFADEAFKGYYNLQQLVLPAGLQKVSYMMVAGCKNLQSIDIPASVEEIEQSAFEDCRSIQSITFGGAPAGAPGRFNAPATSASQLRRIGNWAFYNAHELQHLDIPEGVTEIGDGAFYGCTYLEEMVLPSSVQTIGDNTFALCAKLTKITCNAVTPPTIEAKTFFDVKRQIPVYVPDEAVSAYENDTYWQEFDIQGQSEVPQGIEDVQSDNVQCTKVVRDGQILIFRGDKTYTLTGQEIIVP